MIDYTLPLDQLPDPLPIEPLRKPFDVTITPPGSKSITCRAYVLAALAKGESKIIRPLRADDTDHLLNALCTLGAEARWEGEDVYIKGVGGRFPRGGNLYMGEGGTPTRFMIACACLAKEPVTIDASPRMRERPISEGVDMLRQLGAKIEYVEAEGRLPVRVTPSQAFVGGALRVGMTESSQFLSALLLVGSHLANGICLEFTQRPTSISYLILTLGVLDHFGINGLEIVENIPHEKLVAPSNRRQSFEYLQRVIQETWYPRICIVPQSTDANDEFNVYPDASSSVYWWLASAIVPRSIAWIPGGIGVEYSEPDYDFVTLIESFGCEVNGRMASEQEIFGAMGVKVRSRISSSASIFDLSNMPDGSLAVAILVADLDHPARLTGLRTLRVKETDRIEALANELRKVGCTVETGEDWIEITPPKRSSHQRDAASDDRREEDGGGAQTTVASSPSSSPMTPSTMPHAQRGLSHAASKGISHRQPIIIETYNDHRMAMAFAVLGLNPPNGVPLAIRNPKCVAKSYPGFWKDFAKLYR